MLEVGVLVVIVLAALSVVWFTLTIGISPMPSSAKARGAILVASEIAAEGTIIELGSGWGTLLFALARKYPERPVIGYELSWLPWLYTRLYQAIFQLHNVRIYRQNFLAADISAASLLVCYLFPKGMVDLNRKLVADGGSQLLISNTFALPACKPVQTIRLSDIYNTPVYIYQRG